MELRRGRGRGAAAVQECKHAALHKSQPLLPKASWRRAHPTDSQSGSGVGTRNPLMLLPCSVTGRCAGHMCDRPRCAMPHARADPAWHSRTVPAAQRPRTSSTNQPPSEEMRAFMTFSPSSVSSWTTSTSVPGRLALSSVISVRSAYESLSISTWCGARRGRGQV